jgi:hypothetical protein
LKNAVLSYDTTSFKESRNEYEDVVSLDNNINMKMKEIKEFVSTITETQPDIISTSQPKQEQGKNII